MVLRHRSLHPRASNAGCLARRVGIEGVDHRGDLVEVVDRLHDAGGRRGRELGDVLARGHDDDELCRRSACLGKHSG